MSSIVLFTADQRQALTPQVQVDLASSNRCSSSRHIRSSTAARYAIAVERPILGIDYSKLRARTGQQHANSSRNSNSSSTCISRKNSMTHLPTQLLLQHLPKESLTKNLTTIGTQPPQKQPSLILHRSSSQPRHSNILPVTSTTTTAAAAAATYRNISTERQDRIDFETFKKYKEEFKEFRRRKNTKRASLLLAATPSSHQYQIPANTQPNQNAAVSLVLSPHQIPLPSQQAQPQQPLNEDKQNSTPAPPPPASNQLTKLFDSRVSSNHHLRSQTALPRSRQQYQIPESRNGVPPNGWTTDVNNQVVSQFDKLIAQYSKNNNLNQQQPPELAKDEQQDCVDESNYQPQHGSTLVPQLVNEKDSKQQCAALASNQENECMSVKSLNPGCGVSRSNSNCGSTLSVPSDSTGSYYSKMVDIYFDRNSDYFKHLQGDCLCARCTCGRCKCSLKTAPFESKRALQTMYQQDFKPVSKIDTMPGITMDFYSQKRHSLSGHIGIQSTTHNDFRGKGNVSEHVIVKKDPLQDKLKVNPAAPLIGGSSYKDNFIDWKYSSAGIQMHAPKEITVVNDAPFVGRTMYQDAFYQMPLRDRQFEEFIKTKNQSQFKSPMNPDFRYMRETTNKAHYKSQNPNKTATPQERTTLLKPFSYQSSMTPSVPEQFKSHAIREHDSKQVNICPSRTEVNKKIHEQFEMSKSSRTKRNL